eukprot:14420382-Ditylum_brightwellii.AAC.1
MKESSATVLMAKMNDYTNVGAVNGKRKKQHLMIMLLHSIIARCYRTRVYRANMKITTMKRTTMKRKSTFSAVQIWLHLSQS